MRNQPIKEHLRIILEKMFEGTGIEYSDEYVKQDHWYLNYGWSEQQEQDYIDWLSNYLYTNTAARKELMRISTKNKAECKKTAQQFASFFGWTTVERKQTKETQETK